MRHGFLTATVLLGFVLAISLAASAEEEKQYPTIQPTGFIHGWWWYDETPGPNHAENYKIARARLGMKGDLSPLVDYLVLTEWGRLTYDDPCTLVDAWVNFKFSPAVNLKIGQTWYKFSLSGTTAIPAIPLIYRPEVVDGIWLPMGRVGAYSYDRGVEVSGNLKNAKIPFGYVISVTTGAGLDHFEDNGKKDFVGRFYLEPLKGLQVGGSGFYGYSRIPITSNLNREIKVDLPEYAYGLEASYTHKYFRCIYEYLEGRYEGYYQSNGAETFHQATQRPRGWYALIGLKPLSWIEIPFQYAWHEKDAVKSDTGLETFTVGLTWFFKENTLNNLKVNYIIRSAESNYGAKPRNMIAVQAQLAF